MRPFLDEIEATFRARIYSTALASTLLVPDACGAVEYPQDRNGARYSKWFDTFVGGYSSDRLTFNGEVVWKLRNGMLHETALALREYGYDRVYFTVPDPRRPFHMMHMCTSEQNGETMLNLDLQTFCRDIVRSARGWVTLIQNDAEKLSRLNGLIQFRPNGFNHIIGTPLVA